MRQGSPRGGGSRPGWAPGSRRAGVAGHYVVLHSTCVDLLSSIVDYMSSVRIKISRWGFCFRRVCPGRIFGRPWQRCSGTTVLPPRLQHLAECIKLIDSSSKDRSNSGIPEIHREEAEIEQTGVNHSSEERGAEPSPGRDHQIPYQTPG